MTLKNRAILRVAGRDVNLTNLDKLMFPDVGFTKGQVIDYHTRVARHILPHLKGRPITMKRFPDGIDGEYFYEKDARLSHRIGSRLTPFREAVKNR